MYRKFAGVALLIALPVVALAQKPVTKSETVTVTTTIEAIDHEARMVTLRDKDGNFESIYAGPEVKRFDELKVGDKVTFRYTQSVVLKITKAGDAAAKSSDEPAIVRTAGAKPGATITQQQTATVTIKAIDAKTPAVTVQSEDGRSMSFKVEDKNLLKSVKPGDRVVITYTEALMISVE